MHVFASSKFRDRQITVTHNHVYVFNESDKWFDRLYSNCVKSSLTLCTVFVKCVSVCELHTIGVYVSRRNHVCVNRTRVIVILYCMLMFTVWWSRESRKAERVAFVRMQQRKQLVHVACTCTIITIIIIITALCCNIAFGSQMFSNRHTSSIMHGLAIFTFIWLHAVPHILHFDVIIYLCKPQQNQHYRNCGHFEADKAKWFAWWCSTQCQCPVVAIKLYASFGRVLRFVLWKFGNGSFNNHLLRWLRIRAEPKHFRSDWLTYASLQSQELGYFFTMKLKLTVQTNSADNILFSKSIDQFARNVDSLPV